MLRSALVALSLGIAPACSLVAQSEFDPQIKSISVTGNAETKVEPDEVVFLLVVESHDLSIDTVLLRNDSLWNKLQDLTRTMKIPAEQVKTDRLDLEPEYLKKGPEYSIARSKTYYDKDDADLKEYYARRKVAITLRDLSRYTDFLAGMLRLNIKISTPPVFRTTSMDQSRQETRLQAISNARTRAVTLAEKIGMKVGDPISITEGYGSYDDSDFQRSEAGSRYSEMYATMMPSTTPGLLTITSAVHVVFELK